MANPTLFKWRRARDKIWSTEQLNLIHFIVILLFFIYFCSSNNVEPRDAFFSSEMTSTSFQYVDWTNATNFFLPAWKSTRGALRANLFCCCTVWAKISLLIYPKRMSKSAEITKWFEDWIIVDDHWFESRLGGTDHDTIYSSLLGYSVVHVSVPNRIAIS